MSDEKELVLEVLNQIAKEHKEKNWKKWNFDYPDWKVMCKICGKSFEEIINEEQRNRYCGRGKLDKEMIR